MSQPDLIIHDEKDNVGVVVIEKTKKGQECSAWIMENDKTIKVHSTNEVPLGHKIALKDLAEGDTILKYGHDIGKVVKSIKKGDHVHVHNFEQGVGRGTTNKLRPCGVHPPQKNNKF